MGCDSLETLHELLDLWRAGIYDGGQDQYSKEFLAGTICDDLGRLKRWAEAQRLDLAEGITIEEVEETESMVKEAEEVLASDPELAESALESANHDGYLENLQNFVKAWRKGLSWDRDYRADEGLELLYWHDCLELGNTVLSKTPLSEASRERFAEVKAALAKARRLIRRNLPAFEPAASLVNDYCLNWRVEGKSILETVAYLAGGAEHDILFLAERKRQEEEKEARARSRTLH